MLGVIYFELNLRKFSFFYLEDIRIILCLLIVANVDTRFTE